MPSDGGVQARRVSRVSLRWWLVIIGAVVGLLQVFTIPPGLGIDEAAHFRRAWMITDGQFVAARRDGMAGAMLPYCVRKFPQVQVTQAQLPRPMSLKNSYKTPPRCLWEKRWASIGNTAPYSPVAYAPQAAGIGLARVVGLPIGGIFYTGRLFGLAAYLALCFAALTVAPRGQNIMFAVGLLPMALLSASTFSIDPLLLGATLLVVAALLRGRCEEAASRRWFVIATCGLAVVALCKPPYLVLTPLLLLFPNEGFRRPRGAIAWKLAAVASVAIVCAAWAAVSGQSQPLPPNFAAGVGIDASGQFKWALHHPHLALATLVRTFAFSSSANHLWLESVGTWWHTRVAAAGQPVFPIWVALIAFALVAMAFRSEWGARRELSTRATLCAVVPSILQVVGALAVAGSLFLTYTPVGSAQIAGLQGRYFVPLIALGALTVVGLREPRVAWPHRPLLVAGMGLLGLLTIVKTWIFYYGPIG